MPPGPQEGVSSKSQAWHDTLNFKLQNLVCCQVLWRRLGTGRPLFMSRPLWLAASKVSHLCRCGVA